MITNEEVEIKVSLKNPEEVEKKLTEIATFVKLKKQKDEYFVPAHNNFFAKTYVTEYLRIRSEEGKSCLEYHFCHRNNDGSSLKTDEHELEVNDPQMASVILKKLGMVNKVTIIKERKQFDYNDFEIVIDLVEGLGLYIEVEAKKLLGSHKETKDQCYQVLRELGAEWEETPELGYPEMLLKKSDN